MSARLSVDRASVGGDQPSVDVVVPTIGRPSLHRLLERLAGFPGRVLVVDDRRGNVTPLALPAFAEVVRGRARGPGAARNDGWRASHAEWVAFLDDDVEPEPDWVDVLFADLGALGPEVAGSQGQIVVPLPVGRRPTDAERNTQGLEGARWATADLAYRRDALAAVGGFDERFPRAYREDADLGLRVVEAGWQILQGRRRCAHPVRDEPWWASVARQRGNGDDALMRAVHGGDWRVRVGAPRGRLPRHAATTAAALMTVGALGLGRRRLAALAGTALGAATGELAWARIAPGPRTPGEVAAMLATSLVLGPVAVGHRVAGALRAWRLVRGEGPADREAARRGGSVPSGAGGRRADAGPPATDELALAER